MKYLTVFLLSSLVCFNSYAQVSKKEAEQIYKKITKANYMYVFIPKLKYNNNSTINAYYQSGVGMGTITLNQGSLDKLGKNEIAFILGHELGHWWRAHKGSSHKNEYEADRLGKVYSTQGGYDSCDGARKLFKRLGNSPSPTHPLPKDRIKNIGC